MALSRGSLKMVILSRHRTTCTTRSKPHSCKARETCSVVFSVSHNLSEAFTLPPENQRNEKAQHVAPLKVCLLSTCLSFTRAPHVGNNKRLHQPHSYLLAWTLARRPVNPFRSSFLPLRYLLLCLSCWNTKNRIHDASMFVDCSFRSVALSETRTGVQTQMQTHPSEGKNLVATSRNFPMNFMH